MPDRGFFIAIEGIDGAGKRTQINFLRDALAHRGAACATISFPRYDSFFGHLVARYLNGEFGPLDAVDPHFAALLYAGDRLGARPEIEAALAAGKTLLADRYVASNLAHQAARVDAAHREEFIAWLRDLEYKQYALPAEDVIVYLRLPAAEAQRRVSARAKRVHTARGHDLHEADLAHLEATARVYDSLAAGPHWVTVDSVNPASGARRSPEEIHRAVLTALEPRLAVPRVRNG
jgi:dTMP kinase